MQLEAYFNSIAEFGEGRKELHHPQMRGHCITGCCWCGGCRGMTHWFDGLLQTTSC
jgi:hypothetical protein